MTNNFNVPYLSRTFSEFWNRWHISLSNWLRDYIFFPLSRFMRLKIPAQGQWLTMIIPPVITMCASGLWHGISVNLLLWGAIHGSFLAFERVTRLKGPNVPPDELPRLRQVIGTVVVFLGVLLAWLPFRMDFVTAKRFLAVMILPAHWMPPNWVMLNKVLAGQVPLGNVYDWNIPDPRILLTLIPAIFLDVIQNRQKDELMFLKWPRWAQITACVLMILGLGFMAFSDTLAPFVYQGF